MSAAAPTLVGRRRELAVITRLISNAAGGRSGALLIEGPAGIGKTALLDAAAESAGDGLILRGQGSQTEYELPYGGLGQLLWPIREFTVSLPGWQGEALEAAVFGRPGGVHAGADTFAVGAAALALLGQAADDRPVLALIDDAHWLDQSSADALSFLSRRLYAEGVVVLLARRTGEGPDSLSGLSSLELGGLQPDEARQLLERVGIRSHLSEQRADQLAVATGGNPLALLDLPRLVNVDQLLGLMPSHEPVPIGDALIKAYSGQTANLDSSAQRALLITAVLGLSDSLIVRRALHEAGLEMSSLEPAEDLGFISILPDQGVTFRHPLVRSAVIRRATPSQRRRAHAYSAAALKGSKRRKDVGTRAWHLAEAVNGVDDDVGQLLEEVGQESVGAAGFTAATVALERAAQLSSDEQVKQRRLVAAAGAAYEAGLSEKSRVLLERANDAAWEDVTVRSRAVEIASRLDLAQGEPVRAFDRLTAEAERTYLDQPVASAYLLFVAIEAAGFMGHTRTALNAAERVNQLVAHDPTLGELARAVLGAVHLLRGESREGLPLVRPWVASALGALSNTESAPDWLPIAGGVAFALLAADEVIEAEQLLTAVISLAGNAGATATLPFALTNRAVIRHRRGDWPTAQADLDRATQLARDTRRSLDLGNCMTVQALMDAAAGRGADLRFHLGEALDILQKGHVASTEAQCFHMEALYHLGEGAPESAIPLLERMKKICLDLELNEQSHWPWASDLVEAQVRVGATRQAVAELTHLEKYVSRTGRPIMQALLARLKVF